MQNLEYYYKIKISRNQGLTYVCFWCIIKIEKGRFVNEICPYTLINFAINRLHVWVVGGYCAFIEKAIIMIRAITITLMIFFIIKRPPPFIFTI